MARYKVIYHIGDEISLKTRAKAGVLELGAGNLRIEGRDAPVNIPWDSIDGVEMFRLHGLGRMIKVTTKAATLFLTVVRINLGGAFIVINFLKAGELFRQLKAQAGNQSEEENAHDSHY